MGCGIISQLAHVTGFYGCSILRPFRSSLKLRRNQPPSAFRLRPLGYGATSRSFVLYFETARLRPSLSGSPSRSPFGCFVLLPSAYVALQLRRDSLRPSLSGSPSRSPKGEGWWGKQDSNLRRRSQRIYSPPPLPLGTFPRIPAYVSVQKVETRRNRDRPYDEPLRLCQLRKRKVACLSS